MVIYKMTNIILRPSTLLSFSFLIVAITGCSIFEKKPAANNLAAAQQTAFYTCDSCHGPKNIRVDDMSPKIIGQKQTFLVERLRDYRDLKRINPYMNGVVSKMTNQDIDNLAAYYSNYKQHQH